MLCLVLVLLCKPNRIKIDGCHCLQYFLVKLQVLLDLVSTSISLVALFGILVNVLELFSLFLLSFENLLDEDYVADCRQVFFLQVLDPDHLGANHELLMLFHFFSEVRSRWSEIEYQVEVFLYTL